MNPQTTVGGSAAKSFPPTVSHVYGTVGAPERNQSMTTATDTPAEGLRAWARGMYPLEAATELLIRAGFAQTWRPWVFRCEPPADRDHRYGIDFESIPGHIGAMSGGERRLLRLAATIGADDVEISLSECITGLDRKHVDLFLAAIAHAAGTHEGSPMLVDHDTGTAAFGDAYESLHPWPATEERK